MHRKTILFFTLFISILFLTACGKETNSDALKFKDEYESVNGEANASGRIYRSLDINEKNPFVYKEASDIVNAINNNESFAVYFGFKTCPWCRSVIPTLIDVAKDLKIDTIYYVDVLDIRDTLEVTDKGKVVTSKEGSKDYLELIKLLENVLPDYSLVDSEGKKVETKEKRIYAPNVIVVKNGEAVALETGISDLQTDSYMTLTNDIKDDMYNKLKTLLELY